MKIYEAVEAGFARDGAPFYVETADEEGGYITARRDIRFSTLEDALEGAKLLVEVGMYRVVVHQELAAFRRAR